MAVEAPESEPHQGDDEKRLAELGYEQSLHRAWSSSNESSSQRPAPESAARAYQRSARRPMPRWRATRCRWHCASRWAISALNRPADHRDRRGQPLRPNRPHGEGPTERQRWKEWVAPGGRRSDPPRESQRPRLPNRRRLISGLGEVISSRTPGEAVAVVRRLLVLTAELPQLLEKGDAVMFRQVSIEPQRLAWPE